MPQGMNRGTWLHDASFQHNQHETNETNKEEPMPQTHRAYASGHEGHLVTKHGLEHAGSCLDSPHGWMNE